MATTELALSHQLSTTSLLVQKASEARQAMMVSSTTPQAALKAAKQLVGCFPHARPPDPEIYAAAIGATLAGYPPRVVSDCVDPRIGLARKREFPPTVASVVEWCDARLSYYQTLARYEAREKQPERVFTDAEREAGRKFLADLAASIGSEGGVTGFKAALVAAASPVAAE